MKNSCRLILLLILLIFTFPLCAQNNLEYYITKAIESSPLLHKSSNDIAIIQLDLERIKSIYRKPEIAFSSGLMISPIIVHNNTSNNFKLVSESASDYQGYDLATTDGGQYHAVISVTQPILNRNQYAANRVQNEIQKEAAGNSLKLSELDLEQSVTLQYIICLESARQVENSLASMQILKDNLQIMQELVKNAIYKKTDLLLLQIEYQDASLEYQTKITESKNNIFDLNLLCGIADTSYVELADLDLQLIDTVSQNSVFVNKFKYDSLAIMADQNLFTIQYKPQIGLYSDAGLNATYLPALNRMGFSAGLYFNMKIFDGNQKRTSMQKAAINFQSLAFEKNRFLTSIQIQKNKLLTQMSAVDRNIVIIGAELINYEELLKMYKSELGQGLVSIMDIKNIFNDYTAKKQELLNQKMQKQILIQSYNYLNY